MCGFAAILSFDGAPVDQQQLARMTSIIRHRGPDSSGFWHDQHVGFGFRRLSIQDLTTASDQPMTSADGRFTIVFNGEIYNFVEIREQLRERGYEFRSTGDTEVLLNAFAEWGWDCLPKFNGMWAFLIYDKKRGVLCGSRDRFGIKPLFFQRARNALLFGSEIKAIRANNESNADVDWETAARFMIQRRLDVDQRSFFAGIEKVSPGTAFEVGRNGDIRSWDYWDIPPQDKDQSQDPRANYGSLFADSVRLRLRSDVPLGVFLSGGLDSTAIICEMARLRDASPSPQTLRAFSFIHEEYDESEFINDTVTQVDADLRRMTTDPMILWKDLPKTLWHHDEPVHSMTALIGFELARMTAASGIKVVLNGQGADETTAGYSSYFRNHWHSLLAASRFGEAWREIGDYASVFGASRSALYLGAVGTLARAQLQRSRSYRKLADKKKLRESLSNDWFTDDFCEYLQFEENPLLDLSLDAQLRGSVSRSPLPLYLRIEDRNTMAHGIEARLPFLDYRLVSLLFSTDNRWKMRGSWNKYVLRSAMKGRIPESVRVRPDKMGFPAPTRSWFARPLFDAACELLSDSRTRQRQIFRVDHILDRLKAHRAGEIDISERLFHVLQFEMWMRTVVDDGIPENAP